MRGRVTTGPLFAYGTLQVPEVLRALLGRVPAATPATAVGWRAAALTDRVYPGLVAMPGESVAGLLLTDLSAAEWRVIDAYEDDQYSLERIALRDGRFGWTYRWTETATVADRAWSLADFRTRHLGSFLTRLTEPESPDDVDV